MATLASCEEKPRFSLKCVVRDDQGTPVPAVTLTTQVFDYWKPVDGQVYKTITSTTNADGVGEIGGATTICEPVIVAEKSGYYSGATELRSVKQEGGRWQPWNPTSAVLLKRVRNPIPLKAKIIPQWTELPADICGYDFDVGDWTAPHGKGLESDVIFNLEGGRFDPEKMEPIGEWRLKVTFTNPLDGLVVHDSSKDLPSELLMPYLAPDGSYRSSKMWCITSVAGPVIGGKPTTRMSKDYNPREHLFLRVRTQLDKDGKIISANYAKVHRGFEWTSTGKIKFQYHYNPTPSDRNLEFDPKRNLFRRPANKEDQINGTPRVMDP